MLLTFVESNTLRINYKDVLAKDTRFTQEYLQSLNELRQKVCDTLSSQPFSQVVLDSIDSYLPHVLALMDLSEKKEIKFQEFSWRSVLTKGVVSSLKGKSQKLIVKSSSIYFEAIYLAITYALTMCMMAVNKVGSDPKHTAESALNDAIDLYCRASGLAQLVGTTWATRWTALGKDRPVETTPLGLQIISEFCLLEANLLATLKAEKRAMSQTTIVKLQRGSIAKFQEVLDLVKSDKKLYSEWSDIFVEYLKDGKFVTEALMYKRFGLFSHSEDKNGLAVACLTLAYNMLMVEGKSVESHTWSKILSATTKDSDLKATLENVVRINNNVTYERVPGGEDLIGLLPAATLLVQPKDFNMPSPAQIPEPEGEKVEEKEEAESKGNQDGDEKTPSKKSSDNSVKGALKSLFKIEKPKD